MNNLELLLYAYQGLKEHDFSLPSFALGSPLVEYPLPNLPANKYQEVRLLSKADLERYPENDLWAHLPRIQLIFKGLNDLLEDEDCDWPLIDQGFYAEFGNDYSSVLIELERIIFPLNYKLGVSTNPNNYRAYNTFCAKVEDRTVEAYIAGYFGRDFTCPFFGGHEWIDIEPYELVTPNINKIELRNPNIDQVEIKLSNFTPKECIDYIIRSISKVKDRIIS